MRSRDPLAASFWSALARLLFQALLLVAITIALANLIGFLILGTTP